MLKMVCVRILFCFFIFFSEFGYSQFQAPDTNYFDGVGDNEVELLKEIKPFCSFNRQMSLANMYLLTNDFLNSLDFGNNIGA
ncbi:MAG: hypothetical protein ABIA63_10120, partial [bacterium]